MSVRPSASNRSRHSLVSRAALPSCARIAVFLCAPLLSSSLLADVVVNIGPTSIPRGDAQGDGDITVSTEHFAVAFAVDTAPPWGVARGGIIDIAIINNGQVGYDIASLADFMPNNWSAWPSSYQKVNIVRQSSEEVVVETRRDWGSVKLATRFHIRDGDRKIQITTKMVNAGSNALANLLSGYVVWPDGGYLFGVPGLLGVEVGAANAALADWSAAYDEDWALGLHAPFASVTTQYGRDRYLEHSLGPDDSIVFEAWLQIEDSGSLAPFVAEQIQFGDLDFGTLSGRVVDLNGGSIANPVVVATRNEKPFAWALGTASYFDMRLPVGEYDIYALAAGYAPGLSQLTTIEKQADTHLDFDDLLPPGNLQVMVIDKEMRTPLNAKITLDGGQKMLVGYLGRNKLFTELSEVGLVRAKFAPGDYEIIVDSGNGFVADAVSMKVRIESGESTSATAEIVVQARPEEDGWYSADLHHHSDVLDGFTAPQFVLRAQLAAGLNIAFLSDHDSVVNNAEMHRLSGIRNVLFIPGTELSPSWGHFNAYPIDDGKMIEIDIGSSPVQKIFDEARRLGADIVHVNHAYSEYGYFRNLEKGDSQNGNSAAVVPGGFDDRFDLIEMEPTDNRQALERTWRLWNNGKKIYLAGGSDVHDVWNQQSGAARSYAFVAGELTLDGFIAAMKSGNSFATQGPLVYPEIIFGSTIVRNAGEPLDLVFVVHAISGLRSVTLIEAGKLSEQRDYTGDSEPLKVSFSPTPVADTWFSLQIEDANGKQAYTNPIWVDVKGE